MIWTFERIKVEALKYKTRTDFFKNAGSAYAAARRTNVLDAACIHMPSRKQYTKEECIEMALTCGGRKLFAVNASGHYAYAKRRGWMEEINNLVQSKLQQWTDEEAIALARACKTPKELERKNASVYNLLQNRGLYIEATTHMSRRINSWTFEQAKEEATKFKTKKDFERGNCAIYQYARRRGWLASICEHMERRLNSDYDAIYLWQANGERYNGKSVYKIGVTSHSFGTQRIKITACRNKMIPDVLFFGRVADCARSLERQLLLCGEDPKLNVADGKTEFRALSEHEAASVLEAMRAACNPEYLTDLKESLS